jgi:MATE family multidrug resistance protein
MPACSPLAAHATILREVQVLMPLAIPLILGQLFSFGTDVVSTLLAGHLGARVLAAVSVGTGLWFVVYVAIIGLMMSVQPSVAQLEGAGRRAETVVIFRQGVWLGVSAGVVAALLTVCLGPWFASLAGMPEKLMPMASGFLRAATLSFPALGLLNACRGFSEGLSRTRPTMICGALALVALVPIGYVLMYGVGSWHGLGATGDGLALSAVLWIEALAYFLWIRALGRYQGIDWRGGGWRPEPVLLRRLLRIGLPIAVTLVTETVMFCAATLVIAHFGAVAVAAHQIALTVSGLLFMLPLGLSMAVTVRVATRIGEGDRQAARKAGFAGVALMLVTQTIGLVVLVTAGGGIAVLFTLDPRVIQLAAVLLGLAAVFQLSDGMQVVASGALRGLPDTRVPMILALFSYWAIGMPTGLWLAFTWVPGPAGIWIGLITGLTVAALLLGSRFLLATRRRRWRPATAPFLSPGKTR